jgi:hypothetical protein
MDDYLLDQGAFLIAHERVRARPVAITDFPRVIIQGERVGFNLRIASPHRLAVMESRLCVPIDGQIAGGDVIDRDHAEPARGYDVLMEGRFMA